MHPIEWVHTHCTVVKHRRKDLFAYTHVLRITQIPPTQLIAACTQKPGVWIWVRFRRGRSHNSGLIKPIKTRPISLKTRRKKPHHTHREENSAGTTSVVDEVYGEGITVIFWSDSAHAYVLGHILPVPSLSGSFSKPIDITNLFHAIL